MSDTAVQEIGAPKRRNGRPRLTKNLPNGRLIDVGKALLLRLNNGNSYQEIGNQFGVSKQSVMQALEPFTVLFNAPMAPRQYEVCEDELLSSAKAKLLAEALDPAKLKKSSTMQLFASYGILFDKQRLIRSRGAGNSNVFNIVIQQAATTKVSISTPDTQSVVFTQDQPVTDHININNVNEL